MKITRLALLAALLVATQAQALEDGILHHGCPPETSDCSSDGNSNGGGDYGPSGFLGSVSDGNGGTVDFYSDAGGEWWVENHGDGTSQVGWDESAGPKMKKSMPKTPGAKRPKYAKADLVSSPPKSYAAMKKAEADAAAKKAAAAKAAADKAAADKAAADKLADRSHSTQPLNPLLLTSQPGERKKP